MVDYAIFSSRFIRIFYEIQDRSRRNALGEDSFLIRRGLRQPKTFDPPIRRIRSFIYNHSTHARDASAVHGRQKNSGCGEAKFQLI